jgi:hypothetical protein
MLNNGADFTGLVTIFLPLPPVFDITGGVLWFPTIIITSVMTLPKNKKPRLPREDGVFSEMIMISSTWP